MGLVDLPIYIWLIFMVIVGKYTIAIMVWEMYGVIFC